MAWRVATSLTTDLPWSPYFPKEHLPAHCWRREGTWLSRIWVFRWGVKVRLGTNVTTPFRAGDNSTKQGTRTNRPVRTSLNGGGPDISPLRRIPRTRDPRPLGGSMGRGLSLR